MPTKYACALDLRRIDYNRDVLLISATIYNHTRASIGTQPNPQEVETMHRFGATTYCFPFLFLSICFPPMPACLDLGSITFSFLPGDKSLPHGGLPFLSLLGGFCFSVCSVEESNFRYACRGEATNDGGGVFMDSFRYHWAGGRPT